ncbi:MAG: Veg family protein [Clostridia bacterium]|nr:Veg family protein [Clostridia bacterium]
MIKTALNYDKVKKAVEILRGQTVRVTQNLGRNKLSSYDGVVTGVYQALFTVSPIKEYSGKTSFSYSEIMCGNVRIKRCE